MRVKNKDMQIKKTLLKCIGEEVCKAGYGTTVIIDFALRMLRKDRRTNSIEPYIFVFAFNLELYFIVCTIIIVLIYNNNSLVIIAKTL